MKISGLLLLVFVATNILSSYAAPEPRVLVYTRNQVGKGLYVHDNIAASAAAIRKTLPFSRVRSFSTGRVSSTVAIP